MFQKQKLLKLASAAIIGCLAVLLMATAGALAAQEVKIILFKDAHAAMQAAKEAQADVLAPDNFGEAMQRYQKAEADLEQEKNLDDIRKNLRESTAYFQKAINATKLAEVTFPNSIKARKDANYTEAAKFSSKRWIEAEKKFKEAAVKLEDGDLNKAKKKAGEAETLYRQAELEAIKTNYLQKTRELLKQADQLDVEDQAPKTLRLARQLLNQAEKELNENRYDTDVARGLARRANYEAKHAIYLAKVIEQMKDNDQSWEDLMLASEKPLKLIAEKSNLSASFDAGFGKTTGEIIASVIATQDKVEKLSQHLDWYQRQNALSEARIVEMEQQLGSEAEKKSALAQQIASQAKTRELFSGVEESFSREEAQMLREGNDIIIRLVGLNFPTAKATIEQQSFGLLTKVRDAINSSRNVPFPYWAIQIRTAAMNRICNYPGSAP
ncbi:MAG: hypothetical protein U5R06_01665 [candidate division KSB1 bacterium]|nr:hypothetical protein [candidate division KSB1 bacterium]